VLSLRDSLNAQDPSLDDYLALFANDSDVVPGTGMTKGQIVAALAVIETLDTWAETDPDGAEPARTAPKIPINAIGVLHTPNV